MADIDPDLTNINRTSINDGTDNGKTVNVITTASIDRLAVDALTDISPEGIFGDEFQRSATATFGAGQSQDLISEVVAGSKAVFVRAVTGSSNRTGNIRNTYIFINKVADITEVVKAQFFSADPHQEVFFRAIDFAAGDRIILRVVNQAGANTVHAVNLNGVEVDV